MILLKQAVVDPKFLHLFLKMNLQVIWPHIKDQLITDPIRDVCTFNLTVDHQLVDGAVAAEFMKRLSASIENPNSIFK